MLEQTIDEIYNVAITQNRICVYEEQSAETIPNYERDFVEAVIKAISQNPHVAEISLKGMSDKIIHSLVPHISTLQELKYLDLGFNYITLHTAIELVTAIRYLPDLWSLCLMENEFLTDQNTCPAELAKVLLDLSPNMSISIYFPKQNNSTTDFNPHDIPDNISSGASVALGAYLDPDVGYYYPNSDEERIKLRKDAGFTIGDNTTEASENIVEIDPCYSEGGLNTLAALHLTGASSLDDPES